jgi:hypothetical protein
MGSVMMAISPSKLFIAVNDRRWLDYLKGRRPREIVGPVNKQTVERARRYVWAQNGSQEAFIRKYMGKKGEPLSLFPNLGKYPASTPYHGVANSRTL